MWYDPPYKDLVPLLIEEIEDELEVYTKLQPSRKLLREIERMSFPAQEELLDILIRMNE